MNDLRDIAKQLGVHTSSLSASFVNAFFITQTPQETAYDDFAEQFAINPGFERERTIWRPNKVETTLPLRWKVFLSFLPPTPELWKKIDEERKDKYIELCKKYHEQLTAFEKENPIDSYSPEFLSKEPKEIEDMSLRRTIWEIKKDARRTHFDNDILKKRFLLHKLLLLHQLDTQFEYVQGMNEIISIIIEVFGTNKNGVELESEVFWFFKDLMEIMGDWFKGGDDGVRWISKRCEVIESILETKDEELAIHLKTLKIEMQLFLLRWVRLLFCQVYPIKTIKPMWDVIFAFSGRLSLVDHICVVMIILQRAKILDGDATHAYSVLFNYPIDEHSPDFIINLALASCMWFEQPLIRNLYFKQRVIVKRESGFWRKQKEQKLIPPKNSVISQIPVPSPSFTPNSSLLDKFRSIEQHLKIALQNIDEDSDTAEELKKALSDLFQLRNDIQSEENFFVMF
ncbi:TBC domain containing protein [Entamoeba histolytica HM-1:IMSS-B]|uniref:TBC domain containing protein n=6 Tax=Entamoeba histolytica TaxID=5759 RepID=C4LS84_ENTH1|nr:TBC domain containing protein [Entamoeba histolytica HM-1:IMSS]EMD47932.1 TBC domain containing protein [Entamoeba histolytica KU27]EMH77108.1 TBC domain containing protein [Entamoeba histolytica HM-1:IMSS-B]EMS11813.1 TBC domain containing protein [Entamoeba histolytica HM-3:IMSS]ENY64526.1 TBC domain containing protein [Entamoeba histolytica HM-1:IMSS-A]GAT91543.1 tbc domain containing protein [Entamoeba histolytica]|eukprot:XP_655701.1 TBC domain containing protein [Entamoeba histolytica HM-1:IMSS]